jgi:DNA polymerase III gamma/tau subunit
MRDAVSALDQVLSAGETKIDEAVVRRVLGIADRERFFGLAGAITKRDPKAALQALNEAFTKGLDPRELAEGLAEHIRHLLILKVDPAAEDLVAASADDLQRLRAQTEGWSEHDLLRLLRLVTESLWPMKESPQPMLHLEAAVLQMATLEPGETLAKFSGVSIRWRSGSAGTTPASGPSSSGTRTTSGAVREVPAYGGSTSRGSSAPRPPSGGGRGTTPRSAPMMDEAPSAPVVTSAPAMAVRPSGLQCRP